MKSITKLLILTLVVFLAVGAFAATKGSVTLQRDLTLNGSKLAAGNYKVIVDTTGATAKVTFQQGKKVVATADGKFVEAKEPHQYSAVVTTGDTVQEVRLANMKGSVVFNE